MSSPPKIECGANDEEDAEEDNGGDGEDSDDDDDPSKPTNAPKAIQTQAPLFERRCTRLS